MEKEILDFYEENNIPLTKLISVGVYRRGLPVSAIEEAAKEVYLDIKEGKLKVNKIRYAWEVFERAKKKKGYAYKDELESLRKELAYHRQPWWKKMFSKFKES